jgi:hypothetical protein
MRIREHVNVIPAGKAAGSRAVPDGPQTMSMTAVGPTGASGGPFELPAGWWPVAFSAELGPSPRSVRLGARHVVL